MVSLFHKLVARQSDVAAWLPLQAQRRQSSQPTFVLLNTCLVFFRAPLWLISPNSCTLRLPARLPRPTLSGRHDTGQAQALQAQARVHLRGCAGRLAGRPVHALGELPAALEAELRSLAALAGQDPLERPPTQGQARFVGELARELSGRSFEVPAPASWADLADMARGGIINAPGHRGPQGRWLDAEGKGYFTLWAEDHQL
ncbi:hypothetical protein ABPG75_009349 [Micractinium tetrahymenae]